MTSPTRNPAVRIAIGILLVAGAGPAGFLMYRLALGSRLPPSAQLVPAPAGTPGAAGTAGSPAPQPETARPIPERIPDLSLPDADGKTRRLAEFQGKPLLVNFWATWCEPCRREIPLLEQLRKERSGRGLEVVGIAIDMRPAVLAFARRMGMDYPLLIGEEDGLKAVDAFGMQPVLPFSVFADSQGRIVTLKVGELHPDEARMILDRVADVDGGRLALAAARSRITADLQRLAVERAKRGDEAPAGTPGKS